MSSFDPATPALLPRLRFRRRGDHPHGAENPRTPRRGPRCREPHHRRARFRHAGPHPACGDGGDEGRASRIIRRSPAFPELRAAIAAKLKAENGLDYSANEIAVANGVKQAIANAVFALIEPGDEVILLAPYLGFLRTDRQARGRHAGRSQGVGRRGLQSPGESDRSRADRPDQAAHPQFAEQPHRRGVDAERTRSDRGCRGGHPRLMVLSDEIYEYILFDGGMHSFGALPGMKARTITVNGFSKGFAMTGWRLGYGAAPEPIAKAMARMQSGITAGANSFVQRAAIAALEGPRDSVVCDDGTIPRAARHGGGGIESHSRAQARADPRDILRVPRCRRISRKKGGQPSDRHRRPALRLACRRPWRGDSTWHRLRRRELHQAILRRQRSGHRESARAAFARLRAACLNHSTQQPPPPLRPHRSSGAGTAPS